MLTITIKDQELFNEETNEFTTVKGQTLQLEHSLVSISKWEAKWKKAFLKKDDRSTEEVLDYVKRNRDFRTDLLLDDCFEHSI